MSGFASGAANFLGSPLKMQTIGPNPSTARGTTLHINAHPKEPRIIYPSGKVVVVRNLEDPNDCFVYRGHSYNTTVAKFAPNGFWVASADVSGKVRVWAWDNPEHLLKIEVPAIGGPVLDLDWDSESKRIVVSGESGGLLVRAFQWDTGNSMGEMVGHVKRVTSVTYKPSRPFRVMTCSEDFKTVMFAGPPFKLDHSNTGLHTNFVNCIRYSPDGSQVVSVGSDKRIQFYDGKTGSPTSEITANTHAGTISSVSWSPDGSKILTASADKTCKVWDVASLACEQTFTFSEAPQVGDMQVSVLWTKTHMLSVSLNGNVNILRPDQPSSPALLQAHQVALTTLHVDARTGTVYTGSADGVVCARSGLLGESAASVTRRCVSADKRAISGNAHSNKVVGIAVTNGALISVGWDDCLRVASLDPEDNTVAAYHTSEPLVGQPSGMAVDGDLVFVTTNQEIAMYRQQTKVGNLGSLGYSALTVAVKPGGSQIAVGGDDNKTHVYSVEGSVLSPVTTVETRSAVTAVAYSHSGEYLAVGDAGRQVEVFCTADWSVKIKGKWVFHTSKITCLAWSPSDQFLASGSLDESLYIWNMEKPSDKTAIFFAHSGGVASVGWLPANSDNSETSDRHLVSVGNDHTVVTWDRTKA